MQLLALLSVDCSGVVGLGFASVSKLVVPPKREIEAVQVGSPSSLFSVGFFLPKVVNICATNYFSAKAYLGSEFLLFWQQVSYILAVATTICFGNFRRCGIRSLVLSLLLIWCLHSSKPGLSNVATRICGRILSKKGR